MNKKILMLAFDFPPMGGSGVQRTAKFVKYLPDAGWAVNVLTLRTDQKLNPLRDDTLLGEIPESVGVIRTGFIDPDDNIVRKSLMVVLRAAKWLRNGVRRSLPGSSSTEELAEGQISDGVGEPSVKAGGSQKLLDAIHALLVPDRLVGWFPFAVAHGIRHIRKQRPDIIYSTSPCETAHLSALVLSRLFSIPLVTDFRDPWTQYYFGLSRPRPFEWLNRRLEKVVLKHSSLVVSTAEECSVGLQELSRLSDTEKFHVVTNGYDKDDFSGIEPHVFDKFTLIFTGTVYRQVTPENLFKAVAKLIESGQLKRDDLQLVFVGSVYDGFEDLISCYGLEDVVVRIGYVEHRESIAYLMGADLCYYNVFSELAITAKLFEYLPSRTHILATIPVAHSAARIIRDCKAGTVVEYDDTDAIAEHILARLHLYQSGAEHIAEIKPASADEQILQYEREALTLRLSHLLDEVALRAGKG